MTTNGNPWRRRAFLQSLAGSVLTAGLSASQRLYAATESSDQFLAGQAIVDITPPVGIEMGGFHRTPGNERRIQGIRQPTEARALVLRRGEWEAAILSLDLAAVSAEAARRIQERVQQQTGILAGNVRVSVTHTHSMPAFCYLRQWGAIPLEFAAAVEQKAVEAVQRAQADLAPASLAIGKSRAVGGNFNRTTKDFRTDEQFDDQARDDRRWLDTQVHVLHFERAAGKGSLLWYHFSAHPVCYADEQAGPDWPGIVAAKLREKHALTAAYLQGHAGDVNPGDGDPWRGDADKTAAAVYQAVEQAWAARRPVDTSLLHCQSVSFGLPLNLNLFKQWLERYGQDPSQCTTGEWVDSGFAQDWYQANVRRDVTSPVLPISLSILRIGDLALVFHPSELYSYYGLSIQRGSPLAHTIVVGYTDGIVGYLTDPAAYVSNEYAATVVPKILDFPPFASDAAQQMSAELGRLIQQTVA